MPASKTNYLVLYKGESQVFGSASEQIALETPPPPGISIEDKVILFVTQEPDTGQLLVRRMPQEKVVNAELKYPKKKSKEDSSE